LPLKGRWQLKHSGALAFFQQRQQNNLAIGKFQGIVMSRRLVLIYLSEDRSLVTDCRRKPWPGSYFPNLFRKGQLSSG
jgi:hypothetical protein